VTRQHTAVALPQGTRGLDVLLRPLDRVAGDEVDDGEDDQRHEEEHRDGAEEAAT